MSLQVFQNGQEVPVSNREEALNHLQTTIGKDAFLFEVRLGNMVIRTTGIRSQMYLEVEEASTVAYCLSKRKKTLLELPAQEGSVLIPLYQILQKEDVVLIISCLLKGQTPPDAYHKEAVNNRLG